MPKTPAAPFVQARQTTTPPRTGTLQEALVSGNIVERETPDRREGFHDSNKTTIKPGSQKVLHEFDLAGRSSRQTNPKIIQLQKKKRKKKKSKKEKEEEQKMTDRKKAKHFVTSGAISFAVFPPT